VKQRGLALLAKRAVDVTVAGTALAVLSPVLAGTAVAVLATMGRPVFFRQERVGKDERRFRITKFRTMKPASASSAGPASRPSAAEDDGVAPDEDHLRITPLGRFLRDTSLDELPQLVNVLKGDMSLVGPRPLLVRYLPRYSPSQRRRHEVLPGLTGWAQIHGRNSVSWDEKFARDTWYVEHWSPVLDLQILVRTALIVARREGVSAEGHATMPEFLGNEAHRGDPVAPGVH
jgi:lipopolysaccharide/colanic/teichoic acid biosynthesis glycosyltransferase